MNSKFDVGFCNSEELYEFLMNNCGQLNPSKKYPKSLLPIEQVLQSSQPSYKTQVEQLLPLFNSFQELYNAPTKNNNRPNVTSTNTTISKSNNNENEKMPRESYNKKRYLQTKGRKDPSKKNKPNYAIVFGNLLINKYLNVQKIPCVNYHLKSQKTLEASTSQGAQKVVKNIPKSTPNVTNAQRPRTFQKVQLIERANNQKLYIARVARGNGIIYLGAHLYEELAQKVHDLATLKLGNPLSDLYFPKSQYEVEIKEMNLWSERDYLWALNRQSKLFTTNESGLRDVFQCQYNIGKTRIGTYWEARVSDIDGKIERSRTETEQQIIRTIDSKDIVVVAICSDLLNLYIHGPNYVTNYRPGHYSNQFIDDFIRLPKMDEDHFVRMESSWSLVGRIRSDPLPSFLTRLYLSPYKEPPVPPEPFTFPTETASVSEPNVPEEKKIWPGAYLPPNLKYNGKKIIFNKFTIEDLNKFCQTHNSYEIQDLDNKWLEYRSTNDEYELPFRELMKTYYVKTWIPSNLPLAKRGSIFGVNPYYFPCVIATNMQEIGFYRFILGVDFKTYKPSLMNSLMRDVPSTIQARVMTPWINLPSIRYLWKGLNNVITCNGGLIVVEQSSTDLIVTNPLTNDVKVLPPNHFYAMHQKAATICFDQTRCFYRLYVIAGEAKNTKTVSDIVLLVYSSKQSTWTHSEMFGKAIPPSKEFGHPNIVVSGSCVYYGGTQIISDEGNKIVSKPVLFYFNLDVSKKQHIAMDFSKVGISYGINVVEPPNFFESINGKLYAVSREIKMNESFARIFIVEILVDKIGRPSGAHAIKEGIMPDILCGLLYAELLSKKAKNIGILEWEVTSAEDYIAIQVVGGAPNVIGLYNVRYFTWHYSTITWHNITMNEKARWRLMQGIYEPRWLARP